MSKPNNSTPTTPSAPEVQKTGAPAEHKHKAPTMTPASKTNVLSLPGMCLAEGCKAKSQKANFCMEHFDWFKEGLITKEGRKPTDFDKKHFDYTRRLAKKKSA
jgi:hypothetical protein